jgi:hypothetical protein
MKLISKILFSISIFISFNCFANTSEEGFSVNDGILHFIKPYETLTYWGQHVSPDTYNILPFHCTAQSTGSTSLEVDLLTDNFYPSASSDRSERKTITDIPKIFHFSEDGLPHEFGSHGLFHYTNNSTSNDVIAIRCHNDD